VNAASTDRLDDSRDGPRGRGSAPARAVVVAVVLVGVEAVALLAAVGILIVDVASLTPSSLASALALLVLTALAAVWVSWIAVSLYRGAPWSRGGALFWQLVQLAIAFGAAQGTFAQPAVAAGIAVPSLVVVVLLFTRSVMAHTRREEPTD
jgi:hypothetical protein